MRNTSTLVFHTDRQTNRHHKHFSTLLGSVKKICMYIYVSDYPVLCKVKKMTCNVNTCFYVLIIIYLDAFSQDTAVYTYMYRQK